MYAPPKKNTEYILYVGLISQSDTKTFKSNPTIASGDFKVSTDGGAFANLTTLPTVTPASGKAVKITLSAAEMNGDNILLVASDAAGAEWCDLILILHPASKQFNDIGTVAEIWAAATRTLTDFGTLGTAVDAIGTIVTNISNKIGAFTGSGINTILGFFQALMRNDVSVPSDVGGTYDDASHSLQAIASPGGTGARVVTITVNDGTSPLENAKVRAYLSASENYILSSNASGIVVFNLDDGTWTISITKPGYSFTSQLLVVNGNESQTYSMTQEVIISNPDPDKSIVVITCYDAKTELEADVKIYLEQMTIPTSSENIAFSGAAQEYISDVNGQIELTLWRNAKYRYRRGQEKDWIEFTPNAATYDVTSIVGY